ncbi:hypothetical protein ABZ942_10500 [Nocardia sp. NPDC046473]|uniref:hypothetical protein n=1 Tax=Nocardia sp. NPDC046473 TaxID=3155733 RepID=UPI0033E12338
MRWSILLLEPVNDWFLDLVKNEPMIADKIEEALDELAERGPELGRPLVDRIQSSKALHNLKELRPRTPAGSEMRSRSPNSAIRTTEQRRMSHEGCVLGRGQASSS